MILIYQDLGVSENSFNAVLNFIKENFSTISYQATKSESLIDDLKKATALFLPGGADRFYCQKLNGDRNQAIKSFVENGGLYVGICAGAYYACSSIAFTGQDYRITQERELKFFKGTAIGSIPELTQGHYYSEASKAKAVVELSNKAKYYYHGGCYFEGIKNDNNCIYYKNIMKPALVYGNYGKGAFVLSGVHFEVTKKRYQNFILQQEFIDKKIEANVVSALPKQDNPEIVEILNRFIKNV